MRKSLAILAIVAAAAMPFAASAQDNMPHPMDMSKMSAMTSDQLPHFVGQYVFATDGTIAGILNNLRGPNEAVIAVSAFVGAAKRVVVPIAKLGVVDGKVVIHDATFDSLIKLPDAQ